MSVGVRRVRGVRVLGHRLCLLLVHCDGGGELAPRPDEARGQAVGARELIELLSVGSDVCELTPWFVIAKK